MVYHLNLSSICHSATAGAGLGLPLGWVLLVFTQPQWLEWPVLFPRLASACLQFQGHCRAASSYPKEKGVGTHISNRSVKSKSQGSRRNIQTFSVDNLFLEPNSA